MRRFAVAAGALLLLAIFPLALARADDDDRPLTAAEVARMMPPAGSAGSAVSPAASVTPSSAAAAVRADDSELLTRPTFTTPAVPPIDNPGNDAVIVSPSETQEIPQALPQETPVAMVPRNTVPSPSDLNNYMNDDPDLVNGVGTARDFVAEGEETSPIGFEVREARCRLKTGEETDGLLILKVNKDSPAAKAGLRPYRGTAHHALQALAIGAGMAFPPAMLMTMVALPMLEYSEIGKSYDMIIGVDGSRVTNFLDFQDRMRNVQPGELVYFNLVRNGKRIQIAVAIPSPPTSASN